MIAVEFGSHPGNVGYQEYEIGDYERRFPLAGDFDAEHVEADFEDGVLRLTIPKAPEPEARRVQIRRSGG